MKNVIPFLILLFIVLGCGKMETADKPAQQTNEPPIAVDAATLTKAYDANEIAADGQYKGKLLAVTGKITGISETFGSVQVDLEGHKDENGLSLITVKCLIADDQKETVKSLTKGTPETLIGTGDGLTGGFYVGLNECKIK